MKIKIIREEQLEHCDEEVGYTLLFKYDDRRVESLHLRNYKELKALMRLCEMTKVWGEGTYSAEVDVERVYLG